MLKCLLLILSFISFSSYGAESQDIVFKSRLDRDSSASFIHRIRTFLKNNNHGDPYNRQFDSDVLVDFNQVLDDLPPHTVKWIKDLQSILNLKLFESKYKLRVANVAYNIEAFNSELRPQDSDLNRIEYVTQNYVQGIKLSAKMISFEVELNRTTAGPPLSFSIDLISPEFIVSPDLVVDLPMGWYTALMPDSILLSLHTIDLSKIMNRIIEQPDQISLVVQDIHIPQVSIRIGQHEIKFEPEKIKQFFLERKDDMKLAILDLLQTRMGEKFPNIIKDKPQEVYLPRSYSTKGIIGTGFDLKSISSKQALNLIEGTLDGHFCANETQDTKQECKTHQIPTKLRRQISPEMFDQSMEEIDLLFLQKRANVAISISEHYINQLISAAVQANILDLGGDNFTLGPEKAFVLAEEKGEGFNLYLDIIHKLKKSEQILLGKRELRFPVRLKMGLKIILIDEIPKLQIQVRAINTTDELLRLGLPAYGLESNVHTARFQKKILKQIYRDISPFNQKIMVDLELKEFKGTYLEQLSFASDGKGRATAVLFMSSEK